MADQYRVTKRPEHEEYRVELSYERKDKPMTWSPLTSVYDTAAKAQEMVDYLKDQDEKRKEIWETVDAAFETRVRL